MEERSVFVRVKQFWDRHREGLSYLIFGGLTTLVNWVVFFGLFNLLSVNHVTANSIAWVAAVLFAFWVNRRFVFRSDRQGFLAVLAECAAFFAARLTSFGCETGLLILGTDVLGFNANWVKIATAVVTVVLNYVFSKWIIFRKRKG